MWQVKEYCRSLRRSEAAPESSDKHPLALVTTLLDWAVTAKRVGQLIALPFDQAEEQVILLNLHMRFVNLCVYQDLPIQQLLEAYA